MIYRSCGKENIIHIWEVLHHQPVITTQLFKYGIMRINIYTLTTRNELQPCHEKGISRTDGSQVPDKYTRSSAENYFTEQYLANKCVLQLQCYVDVSAVFNLCTHTNRRPAFVADGCIGNRNQYCSFQITESVDPFYDASYFMKCFLCLVKEQATFSRSNEC
jgi:hypothetical protein